jgi:hypothetical protein
MWITLCQKIKKKCELAYAAVKVPVTSVSIAVASWKTGDLHNKNLQAEITGYK